MRDIRWVRHESSGIAWVPVGILYDRVPPVTSRNVEALAVAALTMRINVVRRSSHSIVARVTTAWLVKCFTVSAGSCVNATATGRRISLARWAWLPM